MQSTSRERVGKAMASGRGGAGLAPDRVPVFCQLALGHYFLRAGLDPIDIWLRSEGFAEALLRLAARYRFDGILVNLPGREPGLERHIRSIEEAGGARVVRWKDGGSTSIPPDDNPRYLPPEGVPVRPRFEDVEPDRLHYVEPWDTSGVSCPYVWGFEAAPRPVGDFFPPYHLETLRLVRARAPHLSVHSEVFSPFSQFLELVGCEEGLLALVDDPGKVEACLDRLAAGAEDLALRQAAIGIDALLISSAYAGAGFLSRAHYRRFVAPCERRLVAALHSACPGLPVYTHTCGAIGDRLDLMLETGTDGIDTLDPPPLGTVDLVEAKRFLAGRAFIKGNLDPVHTILEGTVDEVRRAARERIAAAAGGGGYILSTACSVPPAAPPENLEVLAEVAEEQGRY